MWDEWTIVERLLVIFIFWLVSAVCVLIFEKRNMKRYENVLKSEIEMYKCLLNKQTSLKTKVVYCDIPDGTVEAVKYAVKCSHPDNGGNEKDFIKFKKCYDALKDDKKT